MTKPSLLLLHGALGSAAQLDGLARQLASDFEIHRFNFSGHGGNQMPTENFSIKLFAREIASYLNEKKPDRISIFGYSMGGYAAVSLARHAPQNIDRILTLATKWDWTAESGEREARMLNPDKMEEKIPDYAAALARRHAPQNWKELVVRTAGLMRSLWEECLTDEDLQKLETPVRIGVGDRDTMVTLEESMRTYRLLKNGSMFVLPDTPHPIEKVNEEMLCRAIRDYFISP